MEEERAGCISSVMFLACNHLVEEERAGCFSSVMFLACNHLVEEERELVALVQLYYRSAIIL